MNIFEEIVKKSQVDKLKHEGISRARKAKNKRELKIACYVDDYWLDKRRFKGKTQDDIERYKKKQIEYLKNNYQDYKILVEQSNGDE